MVHTVIKSLEALDSLTQAHELSTLTSLSIFVPYDDDLRQLETEAFWRVYPVQRGAHVAPNAFDSLADARDTWVSRFGTGVERVLVGAKQSLRFLEYILPDHPVPINILPSMPETLAFPNLTTVSIQWLVHRRSNILDQMPDPLWTDTGFARSLKTLLEANSSTITTLRLSLPSCEFSRLVVSDCLGDPHILRSLRVLDATHTAIGYSTLVEEILPAHSNLEHLILDDGAQYAPGGFDVGGYCYEEDEDGDEGAEEVAPSKFDELTWTWMGVGYTLEKRQPPFALKSICAAFQAFHMGQIMLPLEPEGVREAIKKGVLRARGVDEESAEDGLKLIVCGAWPSEGKIQETEPVRGRDREAEPYVFSHVSGCGHFEAYAEGPRPANIWRPNDWMPGSLF